MPRDTWKFLESLSEEERNGFLLGKGVEKALQSIRGPYYDFFAHQNPKKHRYFSFLCQVGNELKKGGISPFVFGYVVARYFLSTSAKEVFPLGFLGTKKALEVYFNLMKFHDGASEEAVITSLYQGVLKVQKGWRVGFQEALDILESGGRLGKEERRRLEQYHNLRRRFAD